MGEPTQIVRPSGSWGSVADVSGQQCVSKLDKAVAAARHGITGSLPLNTWTGQAGEAAPLPGCGQWLVALLRLCLQPSAAEWTAARKTVSLELSCPPRLHTVVPPAPASQDACGAPVHMHWSVLAQVNASSNVAIGC